MAQATTERPARAGKAAWENSRAVFANGEFRALWIAQVLSIAGDQFARVALAVLVYDRTRSPLLAAVVFAATTGAMFAGGLLLSWVADRWPCRTIMIVLDVACLGVVLVMTVPGLPLWVLVGLLFLVGLAVEPFLAARMKTNREVLPGDRFQFGLAVTITTYAAAQMAGFALGGVVAGLAGTRAALLIDAATFAASALVIRFGTKARPGSGDKSGPVRPGILLAGVRTVFGHPLARVAMLVMWLAAFFGAPEGVAAPLARQLGGGSSVTGWLLAAMSAGGIAGPLLWQGMLNPARRMRLAALAALAACAVLVLFVFPVALAGCLVILAASGLFTGFIPTASDALFEGIPREDQAKASGVVGAGMSLVQGLAVLAAGAAAQVVRPSLVVAASGAVGTVIAGLLAVQWRRVRPR